jgi:hypothetical protein
MTPVDDELHLVSDLLSAAASLLVGMRLSPGGDEYVYRGGTNEVDELYLAIQRLELSATGRAILFAEEEDADDAG